MEGRVSKLLFFLAVIVSFASVRNGSARLTFPVQRHWRETDSETLWTHRYNNCDYGYYVLLADGVVGHDTLPPSPNHGFRISLPDVGTTSYVLDKNERFIWVDASYNTNDAQSLADIAHEEEGDQAKIVVRTATEIAGLPAIRFKMEDASRNGKVFVEVETVALRAGIIYTIGM